jgi:hypothetical protein
MSISNRLPQQDAREYLENQVREQHKCRTEAEGTALDNALSAGDLLLAVNEKYKKRDYGGRTALFERTTGSARTGRQYVFLARHRDLLEGKPAGPAGFSGHGIESALKYIRDHNKTDELESEASTPTEPASTSTPFSPLPVAVTRDDIGENSRAETERYEVRIEEQGREIRRLTELVTRLENRLEEDPTPIQLQAWVEKLGWSPTPTQLQAWVEKLGWPQFRQEILPPDWTRSLTNTALSVATPEKLIETLERRLPSVSKSARRHFLELKKAVNQPPTITGRCEEIRLN